MALPRAQMHLVDQQLAVHRRLFQPLLPPFLIPPRKARDVVYLAVRPRPRGRMEGIGVGLPHHPAVRAGDDVLIGVVHPGVLRRRLPYAAVQPRHGAGRPAVEVTGQRHSAGVGRPHPEGIALAGRGAPK